MSASGRPISVAFDLKRLADSIRLDQANYGITQYAAALYRGLRESDRIRLTPVAFADRSEPCLATLDAATGRVEKDLGQDIERSWRRRRAAPRLVEVLHRLGRMRGRRFIAPLVRQLDRVVFERTPFPSASSWSIYHSPINALPPVQWTGGAIRVLSVMDVIHLRRPDIRPERFLPGVAPVRVALDSVDVRRDYIVCISEATRRDMMTLLPIPEERTAVIHLAATDVFDRPVRDRALAALRQAGVVPGRFVLVLGQYDPRKNLSRLAKAFRIVIGQERFADYSLVVVSSQFRKRRIEAEFRAAGLGRSCCSVMVDVDDRTLAGLLACAALFVYVPLLEGFGIPVVEAMKAECPVVVSNTSSLPEVAGEAGFYVDPTSIDDIAHGIGQVLDNPSLRESMRARGRVQARLFSWDKTAEKTVAFYERILG